MSGERPDPVRVVVVDDHEAVRAGLERVLERSGELRPVAVLPDGRGLAALLEREAVDLVVLDYDLERGDGLSTCLRVKQRDDPPAVLVYSGYAAPGLAFAATVAQADGILSKAEPVDALLDAIRRLAAGERLLGAPETDVLDAAAARLAPEDLPVMALLADGARPEEIAQVLAIEPGEALRRALRVVGLLQARSPAGV